MIAIPNMEKPKSCGECDLWSNCFYPKNPYAEQDEYILDDCPLIEIDEPKVGRWIDTKMTCYGAKVYKCSVCDNEIDEMPTEMGKPIWNYCPNCGAYMGGE